MLQVPTPRSSLSCAVPLAVICAVPNTAAPSQCAAVASQNTICPSVTSVVTGPGAVLVTVAVSVVTVPAVTLFEDTVKVVVVKVMGPADADGACAKAAATTTSHTRIFLLRAVPCERFGARVSNNARTFEECDCCCERHSNMASCSPLRVHL